MWSRLPRKWAVIRFILAATLVVATVVVLAGLRTEKIVATSDATTTTLSFAERVAAQRAIEEVYWRHRTWPESNPGPKPGLDEVLPPDRIAARVEDDLRKSAALEAFWGRPITA